MDPDAPGGKVRVGFFSFTEITDPAAHRRYNEWHQLDHLPEQLPLPGLAAGDRWVSTPARRAQRAVDNGSLTDTHYVTLYLMTEPIERTLDDFAGLAVQLHEEDRFFGPRQAHLAGPFDVIGARAAPRVKVSAPAVAFRPVTGVYVLVDEASDDGDSWRRLPEGDLELVDLEGVAGVWIFAAAHYPARRRPDPGRRRITVCYLDGDLDDVSDRMTAVLARRAPTGTETVLAGPFETIVPWQWDFFEPAG